MLRLRGARSLAGVAQRRAILGGLFGGSSKRPAEKPKAKEGAAAAIKETRDEDKQSFDDFVTREIVADDVPVMNLPARGSARHVAEVRKAADQDVLVATSGSSGGRAGEGEGEVVASEPLKAPSDDVVTLYKRSTLSFTSAVDSRTVVGVGLGELLSDASGGAGGGALAPANAAGSSAAAVLDAHLAGRGVLRTSDADALAQSVILREHAAMEAAIKEEAPLTFDQQQLRDEDVWRESGSVAEDRKRLVEMKGELARLHELHRLISIRERAAAAPAPPAETTEAAPTPNDGVTTGAATTGLSLFAPQPSGELSAVQPSSPAATPAAPQWHARVDGISKAVVEARIKELSTVVLAIDKRRHMEAMSMLQRRFNVTRGTAASHNEHALLVDLDFDRDSLLFGSTREEFEENVAKMKRVIIGYHRWERRDNFYRYGATACKMAAVVVALMCYREARVRDALRDNFEAFSTIVSEDIANLERRRKEDFARAAEEVRLRPPDFKPLQAAIEAERERVRAQHARQQERDAILRRALADVEKRLAVAAQLSGDGQQQQQQQGQSRRLVFQSQTAATDDANVERVKDDLIRHDELTAAARNIYAGDATPGAAAAGDRKGILTTTAEVLSAVINFRGLRYMVAAPSAAQQFTNPFAEASGAGAAGGPSTSGANPASVRAAPTYANTSAASAAAAAPLSRAEEDNRILANMSYSVSPVSIAAVKALRRIVLPRAEDFTAIVRQEMAAYRVDKAERQLFPK